MRNLLYTLAPLLGDVNAVKHGRVARQTAGKPTERGPGSCSRDPSRRAQPHFRDRQEGRSLNAPSLQIPQSSFLSFTDAESQAGGTLDARAKK